MSAPSDLIPISTLIAMLPKTLVCSRELFPIVNRTLNEHDKKAKIIDLNHFYGMDVLIVFEVIPRFPHDPL